jgi:hypothetical protein
MRNDRGMKANHVLAAIRSVAVARGLERAPVFATNDEKFHALGSHLKRSAGILAFTGALAFGAYGVESVHADIGVGDVIAGKYRIAHKFSMPAHGSSDLAAKDGVWYSLDKREGNVRTIDPQAGSIEDFMYIQGFLGNWGMSLHNAFPDDNPQGLAINGNDVYMGTTDLYLQQNDPNLVRTLTLAESDEQNPSVYHNAFLTHRSRDLAFGNGELYSIGDDGIVNVMDPRNGNVLRSFAAPRRTASLAYTQQGTLLGASWGVGDHTIFSEFSLVDGTLLWEENVGVSSGVFSMGVDSQTGDVGFAAGSNSFYLMEPVPEPSSLGFVLLTAACIAKSSRRDR